MTSLSDLFVPKETNWLIAKGNKIDHLEWSEESSRNLHQIEHIDLANSSIYSLGGDFFSKLTNFTQLRFLNLSGNKLDDFNQDIKQSNLSEIHLSGNPIKCNCDMFWFAEWLNATEPQSQNRIVRDYQDVKCVGGKWNGTQVCKLNKEQMGCLATRSIREL